MVGFRAWWQDALGHPCTGQSVSAAQCGYPLALGAFGGRDGPLGKDSDAGRDWGHEEKGMTEDEMAGWHH